MSKPTLIAVHFGLLVCASIAQEDIHSRYWRALNQGRDVSAFERIAEQLVFPALRKAPERELEREARSVLERIENSAPAATRRPGGHGLEEPRLGTVWPSLGGSPSHAGFTRDPGPRHGIELWRHPVGWDWRSPALIRGGKVYIASPGTRRVMSCYDRRTGKLRWAARLEAATAPRRSKAASPVTLLDEKRAAVVASGPAGEAQEIFLVDTDRGTVLRRLRAAPEEREFAPAASDSESRFAYRDASGDAVTVKLLPSGRVWWRFTTGRLSSEPVAAAGMIYAASEERLWALNIDGDSRVAWSYRSGAPFRSAPAVGNGALYAGSINGYLHALDARSGTLRWKTKISSGEPRARTLFSTPVVSGDRVFVGAADGFLYALRTSDGRLLWGTEAGDWLRARPFVRGSVVVVCTVGGEAVAWKDNGGSAQLFWRKRVTRHPVLADLAGDESGVLIASTNLTLTALSLADGTVQWSSDVMDTTGGPAGKVLAGAPPQWQQAPVIVAAGTVFAAGADGFLRALEGLTGRQRWRYEAPGRIAAAPAAHEGKVFVGQYGGDRVFAALDAATGRPVWRRELGWVWSSPECAGGQVFVGTTTGEFFCLRANDGQTVWRRRFGDGIYSAPAVDGRAVYMGSWDGHYYALDRNDGSVLWAWSPPGWPYQVGGRPDSAAPVLAGGKVIVPILGSRFVALEARTGKKVWEWAAPPWRIANVTAAASEDVIYVSVFGDAYEWPFGARLFALEAATGKPLWDLPGVGGLTVPVVTAGRLLLAGSLSSPYLYAFQLQPGAAPPALLWRFQTAGIMAESLPAISGNLAFFLSNDGWLRAIR